MIETLLQDRPAPGAPKPVVVIGAGGILRDAQMPAYARAGLSVAGMTDLDRSRSESLARDHGIPSVHASVAEAADAHGMGQSTTSPCRRGRSPGSFRTFPTARRC